MSSPLVPSRLVPNLLVPSPFQTCRPRGWHAQILTDQLTLSQPGGEDYAHHINTGTLGFSVLPTALLLLLYLSVVN